MGDPQRYGLKTRNLVAVVAHYHAEGARVVVVSGTRDTQRVREFADYSDGDVGGCGGPSWYDGSRQARLATVLRRCEVV